MIQPCLSKQTLRLRVSRASVSAITGPSAPIFDDLCYQGHYSDPVHGSGIGHRGGASSLMATGVAVSGASVKTAYPDGIRLGSRRQFPAERDPAETMEVLDRLLKFFGDGQRRSKAA